MMESKSNLNLFLVLALCLMSEACPKSKKKPSKLYENYMIGSLHRSTARNTPNERSLKGSLNLWKLQSSLMKSVQDSYMPKRVLKT